MYNLVYFITDVFRYNFQTESKIDTKVFPILMPVCPVFASYYLDGLGKYCRW
jgi:hypothetical protein